MLKVNNFLVDSDFWGTKGTKWTKQKYFLVDSDFWGTKGTKWPKQIFSGWLWLVRDKRDKMAKAEFFPETLIFEVQKGQNGQSKFFFWLTLIFEGQKGQNGQSRFLSCWLWFVRDKRDKRDQVTLFSGRLFCGVTKVLKLQVLDYVKLAPASMTGYPEKPDREWKTGHSVRFLTAISLAIAVL